MNTPWQYSVDYGEELLMKTLWEKEKMLVTSIFSFSHNIFFFIKDKFRVLDNTEFVVCECFQFEQGKTRVVWEKG